MQHCTDDFEGYNPGTLIIDQSTSGKAIAPLPQMHTNVAAAFKAKEFKQLSILQCNVLVFKLLAKLERKSGFDLMQ